MSDKNLIFNEHVKNVSEAFTVAIADRVRRLKAEGVPVVGLQTGDPDFDTPAAVVKAAADALASGQTHYGDSRGLPALRKAIADRVSRDHGVDYDFESEVLVTHGAIHGYYGALQAIINAGDEILVPDPSWPTHANMVRLLGGTVVRVPSSQESGWLPTAEAWKAAITPRTRAIVLNTPSNPTGAVATYEQLAAVNDLAAAHDLYVISDEVYDHLLYDDAKHVSFASMPGAKARTLLLNSFSKTYAMTGWRVGYLCAPAALISQVLKVSQHSITNLAPFVQAGALFAMTDAGVAEEVEQMRVAYARRRDLVMRLWREAGETPVQVTAPRGAFYFFLDMRALGMSSTELAERLLNEAHVAVVPGVGYGDSGEGFLRMTIAASDEEIEAGFRALLEWADKQAQ